MRLDDVDGWSIFTEESGETEIAKLDDAFFGEKDVLRLDVAVDAIVGVAIADGLQSLPDDPFRQHFRHSVQSKWIMLFLHYHIIIILSLFRYSNMHGLY